MKNELESLLKDHSLKEIIIALKAIAIEQELDFDLALDKSEPYIELDCQHREAYPCGIDSVFCPMCEAYVIEGKSKTQVEDWLKKNHWRAE